MNTTIKEQISIQFCLLLFRFSTEAATASVDSYASAMAANEYVNLDLTYTEVMKMISSFKKQGALWNPHLTDYHNRQVKEEAWMIVAAETGIEIATCKRKIKSLMSSGRREKARIINSRRSGNPEDFVEPTWRYWNALKFLRGLEDDEDDPLGTAPEMDIMDPTLDVNSVKAKVKRSKSGEMYVESAESNDVECSEKSSIGSVIASQLRKMYPDQREYAENLINQVLDKGFAEQLTAHSQVRTPNFNDKSPMFQKSTSKIGVEPSPSFLNNDLHKTEFVSCQNNATNRKESNELS